MRRRGVRINVSATEHARDLLLGKRDAALAELSDKLGCNVSMDELNRNEWREQTFDKLGIAYPRTEKGNASFTAGHNGWMPKHPHWLPQLIVRADRYHNAGQNFVATDILAHVVNGRIHAEIHSHRGDSGGTRSSRFSYSEPPLQLMPKHDPELTGLIRGVFLPEEGQVWAQCDYSQQEFRLLVHCAAQLGLPGAQAAADLYRNNPKTDFHQFTAELAGVDRKTAKGINFGTVYGVGVGKLAETLGVSEEEAAAIRKKYDSALPFGRQLSTVCAGNAKRQGYLALFDGTRRHFNQWAFEGVKWAKGAGPCDWDEAQRRIADPEHPWYGRRFFDLRRIDD